MGHPIYKGTLLSVLLVPIKVSESINTIEDVANAVSSGELMLSTHNDATSPGYQAVLDPETRELQLLKAAVMKAGFHHAKTQRESLEYVNLGKGAVITPQSQYISTVVPKFCRTRMLDVEIFGTSKIQAFMYMPHFKYKHALNEAIFVSMEAISSHRKRCEGEL